MATNLKSLLCAALLVSTVITQAQAPIKKHVDKKGTEKIKKHIRKVFRAADNGNSDGHGRHPYLSSKSLPDTIALITFYVYDEGTTRSTPSFISTTSISEAGGNYFANQLHKESIEKLKAAFKAKGIVLLTPEEFLNTEEKRNYYYHKFTPKISKLGSFLSGLENKRTDMAVCADYYRGFDEAAAEDYIRAISLGDELTKKLGVDAVLSVATQLFDDGKKISLAQVKWTLNGPNPVPKQDKKYIGAFGAGYQEGLIYFASNYATPNIVFAKHKRNNLIEENYEGFGELLSCFADATAERLNEVAKKNEK